jgi:hypothetical protein
MQPNRQPNASHAAQVQHVCIFPPFNQSINQSIKALGMQSMALGMA